MITRDQQIAREIADARVHVNTARRLISADPRGEDAHASVPVELEGVSELLHDLHESYVILIEETQTRHGRMIR